MAARREGSRWLPALIFGDLVMHHCRLSHLEEAPTNGKVKRGVGCATRHEALECVGSDSVMGKPEEAYLSRRGLGE